MYRDRRVFEAPIADVPLEQRPKRAIVEEMAASQDEVQRIAEGERHDVGAVDLPPDRPQRAGAFERRTGREIAGIDRPRRGPDDKVGGNASGAQGGQHPRLNRAQAAAPGQNESGLRILGHGRFRRALSAVASAPLPSYSRRVGEKLPPAKGPAASPSPQSHKADTKEEGCRLRAEALCCCIRYPMIPRRNAPWNICTR